MERQLTLLPDIDDKKVQKEVVSVLKGRTTCLST